MTRPKMSQEYTIKAAELGLRIGELIDAGKEMFPVVAGALCNTVALVLSQIEEADAEETLNRFTETVKSLRKVYSSERKDQDEK